MRRIAALLALAALAGCGSGGPNPIVQEAWDEAQGFWTNEPADTTGGAPPRALTRTDIETADVAAIWARLESDPRPTLLYASAQNGAHVTYFSAFRQSIVLRGSQVTGTRGLGWDLLSAWSDPQDPLARPTPPASWPAGVERTYEFPARRPARPDRDLPVPLRARPGPGDGDPAAAPRRRRVQRDLRRPVRDASRTCISPTPAPVSSGAACSGPARRWSSRPAGARAARLIGQAVAKRLHRNEKGSADSAAPVRWSAASRGAINRNR